VKQFSLGKVVATRGSINAAGEAQIDIYDLFLRHARCDWGDLCAHDKALNDKALSTEGRVLSRYDLKGLSFYIVTEWDRSVTTLMLTEEY
jgi:hypothetical protein